MILTVDVTQDDIDNGVQLSAMTDPIARAVIRALGTADIVIVDRQNIMVQPAHDIPLLADTPPNVAAFIESFDNGKTVEPFDFSIELESSWRN